MESETDQVSTTVVEGTVETVTALADEIQAGGGRIVSVQALAPTAPDETASTFEIAYTAGE
jgi:hypothetical protein